MSADLLNDKEFQRLEQEYKFLRRLRGEPVEAQEYVILDIETTGLKPDQSEITEIAAIKIKGTEVVDIFSSLIKPNNLIPANITSLTGIDDEMVKDAPPAEEVLARFHTFVGDAVLIAHNADFDLSFIKYHLRQLLPDLELPNSIACTVKISRFLLPNLANHKLHTVAARFELAIANRHRAMGDAELTYLVWTKLVPLLKEKNVNSKRDLDLLMTKL